MKPITAFVLLRLAMAGCFAATGPTNSPNVVPITTLERVQRSAIFLRTSASSMVSPGGALDITESTTDGIQEALNSVAPTNGTVFLAPGVYTNTTAIVVPTNCTLAAAPG